MMDVHVRPFGESGSNWILENGIRCTKVEVEGSSEVMRSISPSNSPLQEVSIASYRASFAGVVLIKEGPRIHRPLWPVHEWSFRPILFLENILRTAARIWHFRDSQSIRSLGTMGIC